MSLLGQQGGRSRGVESLEPQLGQLRAAEHGRLGVAGREDGDDRVGDEPADREQDGLAARRVQPVHVVDDEQKRRLFGVGRQQAERRRPDGEPILRPGRPERERRRERRCLQLRDPVQRSEGRPQQLEEPGERHLRLRLDPARPQDAHSLGSLARVVEQGRLADPRLADEYEDAAAAAAGLFQQSIERLALAITAKQHGAILRSSGVSYDVRAGPPARSATLAGRPPIPDAKRSGGPQN